MTTTIAPTALNILVPPVRVDSPCLGRQQAATGARSGFYEEFQRIAAHGNRSAARLAVTDHAFTIPSDTELKFRAHCKEQSNDETAAGTAGRLPAATHDIRAGRISRQAD